MGRSQELVKHKRPLRLRLKLFFRSPLIVVVVILCTYNRGRGHMPTATKRRIRSARLNLRATNKQAELIRMGAKESGENVSNFVLESACLRAEQALASKQTFELNPLHWAQFLKMLDR